MTTVIRFSLLCTVRFSHAHLEHFCVTLVSMSHDMPRHPCRCVLLDTCSRVTTPEAFGPTPSQPISHNPTWAESPSRTKSPAVISYSLFMPDLLPEKMSHNPQ